MLKADTIFSAIRWIATAGGAYLVQRGVTDQSSIEPAIGGIVAIASLIWSIFHHQKKA